MDLKISILESVLKNFQICQRMHQICVNKRRIRKEKNCRFKNIWICVDGGLNPKKMVVVQNRCQKWKECDEISENVNFEASDI